MKPLDQGQHEMIGTSPEIKAVLFDADGVVQRTPAAWLDGLRALCTDAERAEGFLREIFAAESPCLTGTDDFAVALAQVLERWGSRVPVERALKLWTAIEPDQEMLDLIRCLRGNGTRVALATNQQSYRAAFMSRDLDYLSAFDDLFFSCDLGHAKPAPEYFQSLLSAIGMPAGEMLFIDDDDANVVAAREAGLNAELLQSDQGAPAVRSMLGKYGFGGHHARAKVCP